MPVTAKLSRRFYERFGDEVTNELVNWFNAVDETYRNQLRELNELNWERFRSELRAVEAAIRSDVGKQLAAVDKRFDAVDSRLAALEARFPAFEDRLDAKFDAKFARFETRMYKRMFFFWTATTIPLAALIVTLSGAFQP